MMVKYKEQTVIIIHALIQRTEKIVTHKQIQRKV